MTKLKKVENWTQDLLAISEKKSQKMQKIPKMAQNPKNRLFWKKSIFDTFWHFCQKWVKIDPLQNDMFQKSTEKTYEIDKRWSKSAKKVIKNDQKMTKNDQKMTKKVTKNDQKWPIMILKIG